MSNPDKLESNVDQTRESLRRDVARLNDRVSPNRFVETRKEKIENRAGAMKDRLMGSADDPGQAAKDKLGNAVGSVKDATDSAGAKVQDALGSAPDTLREQTQGNPLAAGLIAFGAGWLLSSLAPASDAEQRVARKVEQNAGDLVEPLKQSAQEVAGNLQQPLQESAEAVKQTATDAANRTREHAESAASGIKDKAVDAKDDVAGSH